MWPESQHSQLQEPMVERQFVDKAHQGIKLKESRAGFPPPHEDVEVGDFFFNTDDDCGYICSGKETTLIDVNHWSRAYKCKGRTVPIWSKFQPPNPHFPELILQEEEIYEPTIKQDRTTIPEED